MKPFLLFATMALIAGCMYSIERRYFVVTVPSSSLGNWEGGGACRMAAERVAAEFRLIKTIEGRTSSIGYVIDFYDRRSEIHLMVFPEQKQIDISQKYCRDMETIERIREVLLKELAKHFDSEAVLIDLGRERARTRTLSP